LAKWAGIFLLGCLSADAMSMVSMVASTPADQACLTIGYLVGLALKAGLVDAVFANGTVLDSHVPTPQSYCVPLFDFNSLINLHLITIYF